MATKKKLLQAAAGAAAGGAGLNIEDVFSTYLYTGDNGSNRDISNGIDLSTEGGMVWWRPRDNTDGWGLIDTERGAGKNLRTHGTFSEYTDNGLISAFNTDGYRIGGPGGSYINSSSNNYVSFSFRKAPKFFDVVTYTGDGTGGRAISHNLGSVPGTIIVKQTSSVSNWPVYHRSLGSSAYVELNSTGAQTSNVLRWNGTDPTSTDFTVNVTNVNKLNETYVAYLFAHNDGDGDFGPTADQDIIKCGGITNAASGVNTIDLGFEAQWVMIKRTDSAGDWYMADVMRGAPTLTLSTQRLFANTSSAESADPLVGPHPTGFQFNNQWGTSSDWVYIAIRRGPMAVPDDADDVFDVNAITGNGTSDRAINTGFVTDVHLSMRRSSNYPTIVDRLRGHGSGATKRLATHITNAEQSLTGNYWLGLDTNDGYILSSDYENQSSQTYVQYAWKRAPNYFDVVAYTGTASSGNSFAPQNVSHNLDAAPEMMWVKCRSTGGSTTYRWHVYHKDVGNTKALFLNETSTAGTGTAYWDNTTPTDSVFRVGGGYGVNQLDETYIAYLFASLDGVSKVGSYTGDGTTGRVIDCGFSSGARFVMVRTYTLADNWWIFDAERGIVSGNDPRLYLNTTDAEATTADLIDPHSSGFIVNSVNGEMNYSGRGYIFYAIA